MAKLCAAVCVALGLVAAVVADEQTCADGDEAALLAHKVVTKHQHDTSPPVPPTPVPTVSVGQLEYWAKEWIEKNPAFANSYSGPMTPAGQSAPGLYNCRAEGQKPFSSGIKFRQPLSSQLTTQQLQQSIEFMPMEYFAIPNYPVPPGWEIVAVPPISSMSPGDGSFTMKITSWDGQTLKWNAKWIKMFAIRGDNVAVRDSLPAGAPMPPGSFFRVEGTFHGDLSFECRLLQPVLQSISAHAAGEQA